MKPNHTDVPGGLAAQLPNRCDDIGLVMARVGDKWTVLVVVVLAGGPMRFNELKRRIGRVSQRMLTLTLRGLERDGLVSRTVFPTVPPRVDYELTALGRSLQMPVMALGEWAFAHLDVMDAARHAYDARTRAQDDPTAS